MTTIDILGASPRGRLVAATPMTTVRATNARTTNAPTRLRLTARGRRVLAILASVPAVIALSIAILSGGGALASNENGSGVSFAHVTVQPGDTLWSIAHAVAPDADPRDVVDAIMRLNALPSGSLDIGQSVAIPAEYSAGR